MKLLRDQIADEEARYRERSEVLLDLPASGRVWEMLTGPGERVSKGQDLMRVLDCSHPLVSANVDESAYNRLEVGGRATFRPSHGATGSLAPTSCFGAFPGDRIGGVADFVFPRAIRASARFALALVG
jgi:HlyD family secretion protein